MNTLTAAHEFSVRGDKAEIGPLRKKIEALCAAQGFSQESCDLVGLSFNEALANVIRHAYPNGGEGPIKITLSFDPEKLKLTIRDWGTGVDPSTLPPKVDLTEPGGLGLPLLQQCMDRVEFRPQPDGMVLELIRKRQSKEARA